MWMMRLGLSMIFCRWNFHNKSTFHPLSSYSYKISFILNGQNATCVFVLFHLPVVHLTWYPSTGLLNLSHLSWPMKTACWLTPNCSASWFLCLRIIFVQFHIFESFSSFPCFLSATSKSPLFKRKTIVHTNLAMKHVCHKLLELIGMIQQQFSSNKNKN